MLKISLRQSWTKYWNKPCFCKKKLKKIENPPPPKLNVDLGKQNLPSGYQRHFYTTLSFGGEGFCKYFPIFSDFFGLFQYILSKIVWEKILKYRMENFPKLWRLISRKPFEIQVCRSNTAKGIQFRALKMTFSRAAQLLHATRLRSGARGGSRGAPPPPGGRPQGENLYF